MTEGSRKRKSLKNILVAFASNILMYVLSLFTSKVIKENLGLQVLGLNGVLSNVISILALSEMGIGTAINFALYKPLAEKNEELIKSIMAFYKKAYMIIALVIFALGLILLPFIPTFIKQSDFPKPYIFLVYALFLINSVSSYLLVYKRTLIVADQKNYVITGITLGYNYVLKISQLLVVFFTSNYVLFLIVQIACTLFYNIIISKTCDRLYPYLNGKANKLSGETHKTIILKIKALFWHSLGTVIVLGTDNLLISYFCGVTEAGKYTSYIAIVGMISAFINIVFDNTKDSVGNFLVTETEENKTILFDRLFFINQTFSSVCSICLIILLTPFIRLWLGDDTVLTNSIVFAIVISFYLSKNRAAIGSIKNAAGLFEQDKFAPLIESVLNLAFSIALAKTFGLIGIVIGTILSTLLVPFWIQPLIVYKKVFEKNTLSYFASYFLYFLRMAIIFVLCKFFINRFIKFSPTNLFSFMAFAAFLFVSVCALWLISVVNKKEARYFILMMTSKFRRKNDA